MTQRTRIAIAALTLIIVAAAVLLVAGGPTRFGRLNLKAKEDAHPPIAMEVGEAPPEPSLWIDIHSPDKIWKSLRTNGWLARALSEPIGQGLAAGWSGFLGTKGGDLAGAFEGLVLDVVADKLLADPFRVIFFSGRAATGAPAFLVARPSSAATGAYDLLEGLARNGSYQASGCPGSDPKAQQSAAPISVSRWLIAEQAVFAGRRDGRLALAKSPAAVVQALCVAPADVPSAPGIDLSVTFSPDALGREAQLAAVLLGLGPAPRLAFALAGDRLEPRGVLGDLGEPGRLDATVPPESLLKLVPADAGVVFVATLRLPAKLTRESLKQHLAKTYSGDLAARPVAVVWSPHGNTGSPTEVAVIWPERDSALLEEVFSGPNRLERRRVCEHEVLASTGTLADAVQRACEGKSPSILHAAPPIVEGLRQPLSLGVGFNSGLVLSRLLGDAYAAEASSGRKPAPEVEAARRLLEELPFLGLRGTAQGGKLVPGGFRS